MDTAPVVRVLKGAPDENELAAVAVALLLLTEQPEAEAPLEAPPPEAPEWTRGSRHRPAGDWTSQLIVGWRT